jgi:T-complex protein 1 subunit eta
VGDGTTSVVVLAGELLKESKSFVEEGVHPTIIIRALRAACELAKAKIRELAVSIEGGKDAAKYPTPRAHLDPFSRAYWLSPHMRSEMRTVLERCAGTALNSKLIGSHNQFFSKMVVDAVMHLDEDLNIDLIGIKKEKGGSMEVR